jgi:hypothetical protein
MKYRAISRSRRLGMGRDMAIGTGQASGELTIGIVGPYDLVEKIMLSGPAPAGLPGPDTAWPLPAGRLVAAACRDEQESADKVARLGASVDVCLFTSQVPYAYAVRAGVLTVPATYVPLTGSALYGALLRASLHGGHELARASIDVLGRGAVTEAFEEIGVPARDVHMHPELASPAALASFHERLWRRGQTSVAFTCLQSVAARLTAAGVPVVAVTPAPAAIRAALRTAALLGAYRNLEEAQLAVAVVEVPALRDAAPRRGVPRHSRDELRLTVHKLLVQEAQRIHAAVSPIGDHGFLITATRGSLAAATEDFRVWPFADRARSEFGIVVEVGAGLGRTAGDAEASARAALSRALPAASGHPGGPDLAGRALVPAPRQPAVPAGRPRGLQTLARLADKLPAGQTALAVDAETASRLLSVTPRTARRLLHTLVADGLAWPLPPGRTPQPGRPRQFYRLLVEKLEQR